MGRLDGRVAVVTGAGGGIGREHAKLLALQGAYVVVNDIGYRRSASAEAVVSEIEALGGKAVANSTSATWDGAEAIVDAALTEFGRIDILVNNATAAWGGDFWKLTEEQWDLTYDVNVKGYYALMRAAVPHMARQGSGAVVNTSSASGFGDPGNAAYSSAKEAVVGLTRTAALELARFGIRVNAIRPVAAGRSFSAYASVVERWHRITELATGRRPGADIDPEVHTADKVAPIVVWLCSDAAAEVNGQVFNVAAGAVARLGGEVQEAAVYRDGGWDLDSLDAAAPLTLAKGLVNSYALADHPELRVFDE
jgi:3-oxoacyl-[acyl-carrier protein] reductase